MGRFKEGEPISLEDRAVQLGWQLDVEANILHPSSFELLRGRYQDLLSGYALYHERPKRAQGNSQADFLAVVVNSSEKVDEYVFNPINWEERLGKRDPRFKFAGLVVIFQNQSLDLENVDEQLGSYLSLIRLNKGLFFIIEEEKTSLSSEEKEDRKEWLKSRDFVTPGVAFRRLPSGEQIIVSRARRKSKTKRKPLNLLETKWGPGIRKAEKEIRDYLEVQGWQIVADDGFKLMIGESKMPPEDAALVLAGVIRGMDLKHNLCGCEWRINIRGERQHLHSCNLGAACAGPPPEEIDLSGSKKKVDRSILPVRVEKKVAALGDLSDFKEPISFAEFKERWFRGHLVPNDRERASEGPFFQRGKIWYRRMKVTFPNGKVGEVGIRVKSEERKELEQKIQPGEKKRGNLQEKAIKRDQIRGLSSHKEVISRKMLEDVSCLLPVPEDLKLGDCFKLDCGCAYQVREGEFLNTAESFQAKRKVYQTAKVAICIQACTICAHKRGVKEW